MRHAASMLGTIAPDPRCVAQRRPATASGSQKQEPPLDEPTIDQKAMGRLSKALSFICGADHAATVALQRAFESGTERDIKQARVQFMRLKPSERKAALAMLAD